MYKIVFPPITQDSHTSTIQLFKTNYQSYFQGSLSSTTTTYAGLKEKGYQPEDLNITNTEPGTLGDSKSERGDLLKENLMIILIAGATLTALISIITTVLIISR